MTKDEKSAKERKRDGFKEQLTESLPKKLQDETTDEVIDEIVNSSIDFNPPHYPVELTIANRSGGSSIKPGNIKYQVDKVFKASEVAATGKIAAETISYNQLLAPFAGLLLWGSVRRGMTIDLSLEEVFVYWVIRKHRAEDDLLPVEDLEQNVYQEAENVDFDLDLDDKDIEKAVSKLKRIDILAVRELGGEEYYFPREYCKASWDQARFR